jgi:hypothetical protein
MKIHEDFSHLWQNLSDFFLEWEMFQLTVTEKIKAHTLFSVTFSENRTVYEIKSKNIVNPERTQTIWRLCVVYWISKPTRAQIRACARHPPARTHAHTHTYTDSRTHTHALTHGRARAQTQKYVILLASHSNSCYVTHTSPVLFTC